MGTVGKNMPEYWGAGLELLGQHSSCSLKSLEVWNWWQLVGFQYLVNSQDPEPWEQPRSALCLSFRLEALRTWGRGEKLTTTTHSQLASQVDSTGGQQRERPLARLGPTAFRGGHSLTPPPTALHLPGL